MTNRTKWLWISAAVLLFVIVALWGVNRYVPWNKLVKVPTSSELGFVTQGPGPAVAPHTLQLDFEIDSTQDTPSRLYKGIAHSGNYSATVYGKNTFSVSIHKRASEIGLENLDGIGMSAWVYAFPTDNEVNGSLVFAVNNSVGVNICWKGITFGGPLVPVEQWTKVSGYFDLKDIRFRPDDQIQLYFWNNSDTKLLVDDFYFVFGAPNDRIGDSALVDLTGNKPYNPQFNIPPFPVRWIQKADIGNHDQVSLLPDDPDGVGEITPNETVLSGHFVTSPGEASSMLVFDTAGYPRFFHYCRESGSFRSFPVTCDASLLPILGANRFFTGKFVSANPYDQLLALSADGIALIALKPEGQLCQPGKPVTITMEVLWQTNEQTVYGIDLTGDQALSSGDLTGDGTDELLLFDQQGSWKIIRFDPETSSWKLTASGEEYKNREWDVNTGSFSCWVAPFYPGREGEEVLTVQRDARSGALTYTLFRYLPQEKKFIRLFPDRYYGKGLTRGFDTLYTTDRIWPVVWGDGGKTFLRYDRTWRYDLKELVFNDTAFQVLYTVDFSGYPADQNPKYYEVLKLVPGNWIDPVVTSILVIARNCKDPDYHGGPCTQFETLPGLPNTLQIYSLKSVKP